MKLIGLINYPHQDHKDIVTDVFLKNIIE